MARRNPNMFQVVEAKSQQQWEKLMEHNGLVVVDAYAGWCGPCKAIISLFRKIKNECGDDLLLFGAAETDKIDSLVDYRGKSQPTFLFYGDGQLVNVMRGCNGPLMSRLIIDLLGKEHQILEGTIEREIFIDKVVCQEAEKEEKQDISKENRDEDEEELAREMTRRKSGGSSLKFEKVPKEVTLAIIKPDAVNSGFVEEIVYEITSNGFEIEQREERLLTNEETLEFYKDYAEDNIDDIVEFMCSGPCVILAVSKAGNVIGEEVVAELNCLVGPLDVNTAKEEASESLRAKYGVDSVHNGIHCSSTREDADRELMLFLPEFTKPLIDHLIQQKSLQRTLALIRPNALARKNSIVESIKEQGFLISMEKEIQFTKEKAEEFYSQHKDKEFYDNLISTMISGPSVALCLAKKDAVDVWKEMLGAPEIPLSSTDQDEQEMSLQEKFAVPEGTCNSLHGSETVKEFEREMKILFPLETTIAVIKPDVYKNNDEREAIILKLKHNGFDIFQQKEIHLAKEQTVTLLQEFTEKEFFDCLVESLCSGPSLLLLVTREDAIYMLQTLFAPAKTGEEKDEADSNISQDYVSEIPVHCIANKESAKEMIQMFFPDVKLNEVGTIDVSATEMSSDADGEASEIPTENGRDDSDNNNQDTGDDSENANNTGRSSTENSREPTMEATSDGASKTEISREPTMEVTGDSGSAIENSRESTIEATSDSASKTENSREPTMELTGGSVAAAENSRESTMEMSGVESSREPTLDEQAGDTSSVTSREPTLNGEVIVNSSTETSDEPSLDITTDANLSSGDTSEA